MKTKAKRNGSARGHAVAEDSPLYNPTPPRKLRFIDLFCGIGGFRLAFERLALNASSPVIGTSIRN